jgi:hypothetical protein
VTFADAPRFVAGSRDPRYRAIAAAAWDGLLLQEERSRLATTRLVEDLRRFDAPSNIVQLARRVASDEERHVALCSHVVRALGGQPTSVSVDIPPMPGDDTLSEQSLAEQVVAGLAVAETMSVGGFAAWRAQTREPLTRWALTELTRDEVRHGAFGEIASEWALRDWSVEARRSLWPACVRAMLDVERKAGGPVKAFSEERHLPVLESLGTPNPRVVGQGLLRAIPRWVLPRLARLGVISGDTFTE